MDNSMILSLVVIIGIGVYCFVRGIMILLTGKLMEREEARISAFSEAGKRRYKLLSAVMNLVTGACVAVLAALRMLNLIGLETYRIILLVVVVLVLAVYLLIWKSCKSAG